MNLYIVRHAWAEERDEEKFPDDDKRPLTHKGKKRFSKFVAKLNGGGFRPQLVAYSPLVRCQETAEIIVEQFGAHVRAVELESLRPHSDLDQLLIWTAEQPETEIAWVGHEPDVSALTAALICSGQTHLTFAKGAIAMIAFDDAPERGAGSLKWFATAKLLDL